MAYNRTLRRGDFAILSHSLVPLQSVMSGEAHDRVHTLQFCLKDQFARFCEAIVPSAAIAFSFDFLYEAQVKKALDRRVQGSRPHPESALRKLANLLHDRIAVLL